MSTLMEPNPTLFPHSPRQKKRSLILTIGVSDVRCDVGREHVVDVGDVLEARAADQGQLLLEHLSSS